MNCTKEQHYEWAEPGSHVISKSELSLTLLLN